jgi:hypothetical protein
MMEKTYKSCNFLCPTVIDENVPFYPLPVRIEKRIPDFKESVFSSLKDILYPKKTIKGRTSATISPSPENERLNLQPGDWVQVRSIDEISITLDKGGKYKGLFFMPEMEKFCGKKFKIFRRAEIIKLESTGEVRKLKSPTVLLEGVYCDGERHDGCDRACFHFWREAWLKRIPDK